LSRRLSASALDRYEFSSTASSDPSLREYTAKLNRGTAFSLRAGTKLVSGSALLVMLCRTRRQKDITARTRGERVSCPGKCLEREIVVVPIAFFMAKLLAVCTASDVMVVWIVRSTQFLSDNIF
jgi:hypothetical protein